MEYEKNVTGKVTYAGPYKKKKENSFSVAV